MAPRARRGRRDRGPRRTQAGWDQPPTLFALVRAGRFAADDPETAARLGLDAAIGDALTPIEQEALPEGELDEVLARHRLADAVAGCALSQEIVILPPSAEAELERATRSTRRAAARIRSGARRAWSSPCCATARAPRCCGCAAPTASRTTTCSPARTSRRTSSAALLATLRDD